MIIDPRELINDARAVIALGNVGTDRAVDLLCITLTHPDPQIRAYSAWALGKRGGTKAEEALKHALLGEENPEVGKEIQYALSIED